MKREGQPTHGLDALSQADDAENEDQPQDGARDCSREPVIRDPLSVEQVSGQGGEDGLSVPVLLPVDPVIAFDV